jgi:hypothetical protein
VQEVDVGDDADDDLLVLDLVAGHVCNGRRQLGRFYVGHLHNLTDISENCAVTTSESVV